MSTEDAGSRSALTTEEVSRFARMEGDYPTTRTVSDWAKRGYSVPSIAPPRGRRRPARWSAEDAVCVRCLARLRGVNCEVGAAARWVEEVVRPLLYEKTPGSLHAETLGRIPRRTTEPGVTPQREPPTVVELPLQGWLSDAQQLTVSHPTLFDL